MQKTTKITSPNYSIRKEKINFVVIHYTEMNFEEALDRLCAKESSVSSHYLIKSSGEIFQLVDDQYAAWHAGLSFWGGKNSLNNSSIGIELDNLGINPFQSKQMQSCIQLCQKLVNLYNIPRQNILGHSDIAPDRKIDPGLYFDWQYLAQHNLGIWHNVDASEVNPKLLFKYGERGQKIMLMQNHLQKLGFKIDVTGIFDQQTNFVIRAFQARFYPKLIRNLGLDFYHNNSSKYSWDNVSDQILKSIMIIGT